jgi:hypothetical protein
VKLWSEAELAASCRKFTTNCLFLQVTFIVLGFVIMVLVQLIEGEHHHGGDHHQSVCQIDPTTFAKYTSSVNITCHAGNITIISENENWNNIFLPVICFVVVLFLGESLIKIMLFSQILFNFTMLCFSSLISCRQHIWKIYNRP